MTMAILRFNFAAPHPLVGATPVEEAWKSVQLLTDEVLPALKER